MVKTKIYIAGPIGNKKDGNYKAFYKAEKKLKKLGYKPFNPRRLVGFEDYKGILYPYHLLKKSLNYMIKCNLIYFLKGWEHSKGSVIEHQLAKELNYNIYYEDKKYDKSI